MPLWPSRRRGLDYKPPQPIDPLEHRAEAGPRKSDPFPTELFEETSHPEKTMRFLKVYEQELQALSQAKRKDGRALFHGLGFYPEVGADLLPVVSTRQHGRLVGMSMHESEVLAGCALLKNLGYDPQEVLGSYISSGPIRRDMDVEGLSAFGQKNLQAALSRIADSRRWIGKEIGTRDWRNYGRYVNWQHFSFLPSVSGDETILGDYLGDRKFDYMILKGTLPFRYEQDDDVRMQDYSRWLSTTSDRFLADDAVVLASSVDRPAIEVLKGKGFEETIRSHQPYPQEVQTTGSVDGNRINPSISGIRLFRGRSFVRFIPGAGFTALER
ncbi:MAG: hypothetical protein ABIH11_03660 [Candidatus Altiarchaeota archaeon]